MCPIFRNPDSIHRRFPFLSWQIHSAGTSFEACLSVRHSSGNFLSQSLLKWFLFEVVGGGGKETDLLEVGRERQKNGCEKISVAMLSHLKMSHCLWLETIPTCPVMELFGGRKPYFFITFNLGVWSWKVEGLTPLC